MFIFFSKLGSRLSTPNPQTLFRSISRSYIGKMTTALDSVPDVKIDDGKFKYVLIKVYDADEEKNFKHIVRGVASAEFHADIYDPESSKLMKLGLETECVGGGRILHTSASKSIKVYGYSQGFGKADHELTCKILKSKYPDYTNITCTDEGY